MAADGVGARECLEMDGEKKTAGDERAWLTKSGWGCKLGCADGWKGVESKEAAGDERAWLRGRLPTAWVQGDGWKWVAEK